MLQQTDRERLAISTAIAVFLYAGIFAATAWLDILQPAEPKDYGSLTVQIALREPEPREIPPPETEISPETAIAPESVPERTPSTEPERAPEQTPPAAERPPERTPVPTAQPQTERTPLAARQQAAEPAPQPPSVTDEAATAGTSPGTAATEAVPSSSGGDAVARSTAPTEGETASEAVPVRDSFEAGESTSVTAPPTATGSEFFRSADPETPTDIRGEDEIVFGEPEARAPVTSERTQRAGDGERESFVDSSQLDRIAGRAGSESGDGTTTGTGNGDGVESEIFAESFSELMSQRGVVLRYDPDIRTIGLPGGLRKMDVWVEFVIMPNGVVQSVSILDDTGDSTLNARIREALTRWKFEPIQQDVQQVARLLYLIEAD